MVLLSPLVASALAAPEFRTFGVSVDAGVPSVASVGLVVRPVRPLSIGASLSTHGAGLGGRVDVNLRASWKVSPLLNAEAGLFAPSNGNALLERLGSTVRSPLLERVDLRYASLRTGLDVGNDWAVFTFQLGCSALWARSAPGEGTVKDYNVRWETIEMRALVPSARVGLVFWLKG